MESGKDLLSNVFGILNELEVFDASSKDAGGSIIKFKYPRELMDLIDISLKDNEGIDDQKIESICRDVIKYSVKTNRQHFHNQLFNGMDLYGICGAWITEALNTSQYTFEMAPVLCLIENVVIEKALELFKFGEGDGIFAPGGSMANMFAMVCARYKSVPDIKRTGLFRQTILVAYTSEDAHYSIKKASHWIGIGTDNLIHIKSNENGQMIAAELERAIRATIEEGKKPFFVNATAGTTLLGAFDDFESIADVCEKYGVWMHVDGCLGSSAILSRKHSHLLKGTERANSLTWNPHKSLGVPLQCSMVIFKQKAILQEVNSANADYLFQSDKFYDASYDTGDKSVQCGRKVDSFKFWLMLKKRGIYGMERLLDNAFSCSQYLVQQLKVRSGFKLVQENPQYTNVCFWYIPKFMQVKEQTDDWWKSIYKLTTFIKEQMVKKGDLMITYAPMPHKNIGNFFRMVVTCSPPQTNESMDFVLDEIERIAEGFEVFDQF